MRQPLAAFGDPTDNATVQIRQLSIRRFRCLEAFDWQPGEGISCLLGPADSGKSTVLAALSLLFNPAQAPYCSDFDYFKRRTDAGFEIEAVIAGIEPGTLGRIPILHGWKDGGLKDTPEEAGTEPVAVFRVTGAPDLELTYSIAQPGGELSPLASGVRAQLPFGRLTSWEYGSRELRLGRNSLLNKSIQGTALKSAIHDAAASTTANLPLPDEIRKRLDTLKERFGDAGLPSDLHLGLIAPPDSSLAAMFGLMAGTPPNEAIPLTLAGTGTRQNALFTLMAALTASPSPLLVLDEPEMGLEPYRQRGLISRLRGIIGVGGQAILTTHSVAVVNALASSELWRLSPGASPVSLRSESLESLRRRAPDCFVSALPILAEGDTEAGMLEPILESLAVEQRKPDIATLGLRIVRGNGQPRVLTEAQGLLDAGFSVGLFLDEETTHQGTRKTLGDRMGCTLQTWQPIGVRNIEEALAKYLPFSQLIDVVHLAASLNDSDAAAYYQKINETAGRPGVTTPADLVGAIGEDAVRSAIAGAMDNGDWFKTVARGRRLAEFLLEKGIPREIDSVFRPFGTQVIARVCP